MSDNLIMLSIVLVVLAGIAIPFIRKAISHRKAIGAGTPEKEIEIRVQPADNIYFLRYILTYKAPFKSSKTVRIRPEYVDAIRKACRIIKGRQNDCHRLCGQGAGGAFYGTCGRYRPPLQGKTR